MVGSCVLLNKKKTVPMINYPIIFAHAEMRARARVLLADRISTFAGRLSAKHISANQRRTEKKRRCAHKLIYGMGKQ